MNDIQRLEKLLQEEKDKERSIALNKELVEIKEEFEGKCFGSNLFNRLNKSRYFSIVYYERFFTKEDSIYVIEWVLHGQRRPAFYKEETPTYDVNTYINERKLTNENYNASYNLFNGYHFYRKPITKEEFMSLWRVAKECYLIIRDAFKEQPNLEIEDVRQGDHGREQTIEKIITELGIDLIDLKLFPKMFWIFEYKTLPMLQNGRWLPRIYAKQLLEYCIKDFEKDKRRPFTTSRDIQYYNERIDTIKEFIDSNL